MPVSKHFDRSKELITFICHGELSFDEIISALETMYADEDIEYIRDVIWDLSNATLSGMSDEEMLGIGAPKIQLRHSKN